MIRRVVVPFSAAPASTASIPAIAREHDAEVVALVLDLGEGHELEVLRDRALHAGAIRVHVLDVREEFARDYVMPSLQSGALLAGSDPLGGELAARLVAQKLAEIAQIEDATPVVANLHASTLWGRVGAYIWTRPASDAPESAAEVDITFEKGVPTAVNGVAMIPIELIEILNIIAGHHGVGRIDMGDTHGEAPAAVVLQSAYNALQNAVSADERPAHVNGSVRVMLRKGALTVAQCDLQVAAER